MKRKNLRLRSSKTLSADFAIRGFSHLTGNIIPSAVLSVTKLVFVKILLTFKEMQQNKVYRGLLFFSSSILRGNISKTFHVMSFKSNFRSVIASFTDRMGYKNYYLFFQVILEYLILGGYLRRYWQIYYVVIERVKGYTLLD